MRTSVLFALLLLPLPSTTAMAQPRPTRSREAARPAAEAPPAPVAPPVTARQLKALDARSIGPAVMGGRTPSIALDPTNPGVFYVAHAHGGLFKTTDSGGSFSGVTDKEPIGSVGAVAVAASDPSVIWIGTGEANDRNSSGWGSGVYRSVDGGQTWTHAGLETSRAIAKIAVHPRDPETAYVAAVGDLWTDGGQRGLYKTTDGGRTWAAVLQAPAPLAGRVGAGDVALDPQNPDTVYAALYTRRRTPWSFAFGAEVTDGQDVGGIFRTTDGGKTWTKLTNGLPGLTGRVGLSVYAKNPKVVYAIVQSAEGGVSDIDTVRSRRGGVFRSDDGGQTWVRRSPLNPRPFYFSKIRVDPNDDRKVYVLGFSLHVSEDGGETFREDRFKSVHPDLHELVIDPANGRRLVLGTDGGVYQSWNGGESWTHLSTVPMGEFYRIAVDQSVPYRICGGLQDNVNWVGPSRTRTKDGIVNADWVHIYGGDGFSCAFDPDDPDIVYAEAQSGSAYRIHLKSGAMKPLRPEPSEGQQAFRFHWNSPLVPSVHQRGLFYLAGNRVFEMTARGEMWKAISPDLSTQDVRKILTVGSGAETYGVVFAFSESPVKAGTLWAGTDDGKVWVTENQGAEWTDLTANLPAAARGQWIARLEASHHDARTAYLAVSAFRSGNYAPLVYRTTDLGRNWQAVAANLPAGVPVRVIREDPFNASLLYAGTQEGLFVSLDAGRSWTPFGGLPTVPVDDLVVHPRERDLVIATHGRSLYISDDIRPLQELTPAVLDKAAHLFPIRPVEAFELLPGWGDWGGTGQFHGANPPNGAIITAWVKEPGADPVTISIANAQGQPVAKLTAPAIPGLVRLVWDLKPSKELLLDVGGEGRLFVRPGEYTMTLTVGGATETQKVTVGVAPGLETR